MELIKKLRQLDEESTRTSMDRETYNRLVHQAAIEVSNNTDDYADDDEKIDIILGMVEELAGFEDGDDAGRLADQLLKDIKKV